MPDKKVSELDEVTSVSASSITLYVVDSTTGTPTGKKINGTNLNSTINKTGDFLITQVFS